MCAAEWLPVERAASLTLTDTQPRTSPFRVQAGVLQRRSGMLRSWSSCAAVLTVDSYLHLLEPEAVEMEGADVNK